MSAAEELRPMDALSIACLAVAPLVGNDVSVCDSPDQSIEVGWRVITGDDVCPGEAWWSTFIVYRPFVVSASSWSFGRVRFEQRKYTTPGLGDRSYTRAVPAADGVGAFT